MTLRQAKTACAPAPKRRGSTAPATEIDRLWAAFKRRREDDQLRNRLVEAYQPFVRDIVRRFANRLPKSVDRGDLEIAANVGLMAAIASFDSSRGVRFESYCELRVKGALLDELRTQDWLPRPWRHRLEQRKRVREMLRARWNREPVDEELARAMGMQISEYQHVFGSGLLSAPSGGVFPGQAEREELGGLDIVADTNSDAPGDKLSRDELLHLVAQRLTDQEYRIVYLKYWEELPMREIGMLAGLSESRVCKIHAKLIDRLKDRFRVHGER
jgi:RNA polymerase sigma factor for flagellar operon FliA